MCDNMQSEIDCAVCLQKCYHPTQLPCGHIFCFLCVKGLATQNRTCAMCRATIPLNYMDNPILLQTPNTSQDNGDSSDQFQWYYEGRNGWWKYDERSNNELETFFNSGASDCSLLLAGALYRIDFQGMVQLRRSDPSRRRRIRRDTPAFPSKGIAGIKMITENTERTKEGPCDSMPEQELTDEVQDFEHDLIREESEPEPVLNSNVQVYEREVSGEELHEQNQMQQEPDHAWEASEQEQETNHTEEHSDRDLNNEREVIGEENIVGEITPDANVSNTSEIENNDYEGVIETLSSMNLDSASVEADSEEHSNKD